MSEHAQRFHGKKPNKTFRPGMDEMEWLDHKTLLDLSGLTSAKLFRMASNKGLRVMKAEGPEAFKEWIE